MLAKAITQKPQLFLQKQDSSGFMSSDDEEQQFIPKPDTPTKAGHLPDTIPRIAKSPEKKSIQEDLKLVQLQVNQVVAEIQGLEQRKFGKQNGAHRSPSPAYRNATASRQKDK